MQGRGFGGRRRRYHHDVSAPLGFGSPVTHQSGYNHIHRLGSRREGQNSRISFGGIVAGGQNHLIMHGQAGKGLADPNVTGENDLLAFPHMTPAVVKSLVEKRPFMSAVELNLFLLGQRLTPLEAADFYRKAFVQMVASVATTQANTFRQFHDIEAAIANEDLCREITQGL